MIKWSKTNESFNYLCSSSLLEEMSEGSEKTENQTVVCVLPKFVTPVRGCMCSSSTRPNGLPYSINVKLSTPITHNGAFTISKEWKVDHIAFYELLGNGFIGPNGTMTGSQYPNGNNIGPYRYSNSPAFTLENRKWRGSPVSDFFSHSTCYATHNLDTSCNFSEFTLNNAYKYLERKFPSGETFVIPGEYGFPDTVKSQTQCLWAALFGGVDYMLTSVAIGTTTPYSWQAQFPKVDKPDGYMIPSIATLQNRPNNEGKVMVVGQIGGYTRGNGGIIIGINGAMPFWGTPAAYPVDVMLSNAQSLPITSSWSATSSGTCLVNAGTCVPATPYSVAEMNAFSALPVGSATARGYVYLSYGQPDNGQVNFTCTTKRSVRIPGSIPPQFQLVDVVETGLLQYYIDYLSPRNAYPQEIANPPIVNPSIPYTQAAQSIFNVSYTCQDPGKVGPKFPNGQDAYWTDTVQRNLILQPSEIIEGDYTNDPANPLASWFLWRYMDRGVSMNNASPILQRTSTPKNNIYYHTDISLPRNLVGPPTGAATGVQFPNGLSSWVGRGMTYGSYWSLLLSGGHAQLFFQMSLRRRHYKRINDNTCTSTFGFGTYRQNNVVVGGVTMRAVDHRIPDELVNLVKGENAKTSSATMFPLVGELGLTYPGEPTQEDLGYGIYDPYNRRVGGYGAMIWVHYSGNPQIVPQIPCNFNGWWKMYKQTPPTATPSGNPYIIGPRFGSENPEPRFAYIYLGDSGA